MKRPLRAGGKLPGRGGGSSSRCPSSAPRPDMWAGKPGDGLQSPTYKGGCRPLQPEPLLSPLAADMWVGKPGDGLANPVCEDMPFLRTMPPADQGTTSKAAGPPPQDPWQGLLSAI